jgi:hypothetical protein
MHHGSALHLESGLAGKSGYADKKTFTLSRRARCYIPLIVTKQRSKMSERRLVSSGSRFEPEIGFSRAVRVGAHISVAGTAPISATGGNAALGDVYGQTKRCLEIINAVLLKLEAHFKT